MRYKLIDHTADVGLHLFASTLRGLYETAAMAMGSSRSTDSTRILAETSLSKMVSKWNVKVNTLPEAEVEKMKAAAIVVWDKTAKKNPLNAKVINMMKDFLKELGYIK